MQGTNARSSVSTETRSGRGNLYLDGSTASYFHESRGAWWSSIIYREGYIIHKNKLHLSAFSLLGGPMYIVSFPGPDLLTWATCSAAPFCDFLPVSQNGTVDYPQISHKIRIQLCACRGLTGSKTAGRRSLAIRSSSPAWARVGHGVATPTGIVASRRGPGRLPKSHRFLARDTFLAS